MNASEYILIATVLLLGLVTVIASVGHDRRAKDKLRKAVSAAVGTTWTSELVVRQKLAAAKVVLDYKAFHALTDECEAEHLIVGRDAMPATCEQRPPREYRLVSYAINI